MNTLMKTLMVGVAVVSLAGSANALEIGTSTTAGTTSSAGTLSETNRVGVDARVDGDVDTRTNTRTTNRARTTGDVGVGLDANTRTRTHAGTNHDVDSRMRDDARVTTRSRTNSRTAGSNNSNARVGLDADANVNARTAEDKMRMESRAAANYDASAMTRTDIRNLQTRLDSAGYNLNADGVYGARTKAAIRNFQADNNLKATGRLDADTMSRLKMR